MEWDTWAGKEKLWRVHLSQLVVGEGTGSLSPVTAQNDYKAVLYVALPSSLALVQLHGFLQEAAGNKIFNTVLLPEYSF